jgi:hypothetical protein
VLVVLEADTIIVTMPGTRYSISYRKLNAGIREVDFLARAWRIANDKARELGWIV